MEPATVVVFQDRTWFGDPRMGAFIVFLDGARVGVAPVQGQLELHVSPGLHSLRIGQSWFRSPRVNFDLGPGCHARFKADIPREVGLLPRFAKFAVAPRRCLVLQESTVVASPSRVERSLMASDTARRGLALQGLVGTVGLALLLVGLKVSPAVAIVGAVIFLIGTAVGVAGMFRAKRIDAADGPSDP